MRTCWTLTTSPWTWTWSRGPSLLHRYKLCHSFLWYLKEFVEFFWHAHGKPGWLVQSFITANYMCDYNFDSRYLYFLLSQSTNEKYFFNWETFLSLYLLTDWHHNQNIWYRSHFWFTRFTIVFSSLSFVIIWNLWFFKGIMMQHCMKEENLSDLNRTLLLSVKNEHFDGQ